MDKIVENKSLKDKIIYVVLTLLPMAIYMVFYMPTFFWVESLEPAGGFHQIHVTLDDKIPVLEGFIVPYALWLPYLVAGMIALGIKGRVIARKTSYMLMAGMTLFIVICLVYPNAVDLRCQIPDRSNIFMWGINYLHSIDTPTNVLPSLHVYDALVVAAGIHFGFKDKKAVIIASDILVFFICISTVFVKQHSILDVLAAIAIFIPVLIIICFVIRPVNKQADKQAE